MINVVMVSKACVVGAYQTKLEAIAQAPDVALTVVVPPYWREPGGNLQLELSHTQGYTLLVEPIRRNGSYHTHYYPGLRRILREIKPDIVHMDEEPYSLVTWLGMRHARAIHARTLFFSWQNIYRRYPPPFRWMERQVLRWADFGIMGNAAAEYVWRRKGFAGPSTILPQFGVSPEIFAPSGPRNSDMPFVIGSASRRLSAEKGVDLILTAASQMSGNWQVQIAGDGEARSALEQQAQRLGIADRVHFIGKLGSEAMPDFLHKLDVMVLPSRTLPTWKEQFGRVLVEAMACGVPVIGSDSGEIPHVIGDAGLVFPENDAEQLRTHLQALATSAELRTEFAERGRLRVMQHFTQASIGARTVDIYRSILDN